MNLFTDFKLLACWLQLIKIVSSTCRNRQRTTRLRINVDYCLSVVAVNHSCMFNLAGISAEVSNGAEYISFLRAPRRSGGDCVVSLQSHQQDYSAGQANWHSLRYWHFVYCVCLSFYVCVCVCWDAVWFLVSAVTISSYCTKQLSGLVIAVS